jgi:hypothetical protein
VIGLMTNAWVKLSAALRRAGWRSGLFGGVLIGCLAATFVSPAQAPAVPSVSAVTGVAVMHHAPPRAVGGPVVISLATLAR